MLLYVGILVLPVGIVLGVKLMGDSVISMKKIIEFIKKNKTLSILVLMLIIALVFLYVIFLQKKDNIEPKYSAKMENIESPYPNFDEEIIITSEIAKVDIPKKDKILTVTGFNTEAFSLYIQEVYNFNEEVNFLEDVYLQFNNKDIMTFASNTGILSFSSNNGIPLNSKLSTQEDIKKFLTQYFEIYEIKFEEDTTSQGVTEYTGKFLLKGIKIGSSYLNGNAFIIKVNNEGAIINASILLLSESNIKEYQYLPLAEVNDLITRPNYPKKIGDIDIEDRYYNEPSPYVLTEFIVKNITLEYIFNDFESRYIVPTYVLDGDAQIRDAHKEKYWSKARIFVCGIDPSYLYSKQTPIEEEKREEEGAPFVR
jgi:hypothetical protein